MWSDKRGLALGLWRHTSVVTRHRLGSVRAWDGSMLTPAYKLTAISNGEGATNK